MVKDFQLQSGARVPDPTVPTETIKDFLVAAALHQMDRVRHFVETLGLHPDSTYGGKPTALCYSVLKPNRCLMAYLCDKGANVNHGDTMGMTPLHYAALGGCAYCLAYLVSREAQLNRLNRIGETPLALACRKPQSADCRELLLRYGASLGDDARGRRRFH